MTDLQAVLRRKVLICDGAMGTMLHAAGNSLDRALPELNLSDPALVSTIHDSYLSAGAEMILTNTFGASRLRLANHGYADAVLPINSAGVELALRARDGADREVFVAGSVGPAVTASQRRRFTPAERVAALREQIEALTGAGAAGSPTRAGAGGSSLRRGAAGSGGSFPRGNTVDVLVLETFGYLEELVEAVTVASQVCDVPIVASATFDADGRTLGGESPREVATTLSGLPVAVIGTNCTLGPRGVLSVVQAMAPHATVPLSAQPNAGLPRRVADRRFEYNVEPAYFARYARRLVAAGAAMVGGCCGTTPAQIQAAAAEVSGLAPRSAQPDIQATAAPVPVVVTDRVSGLAERLAARQFVVAAGIAPPLGGSADEAADEAARLRENGIEVFFIASRQSPRAQLSSIDLAFHLQHRLKAETIATVTTWDKSIMTLQADLLGANALGLRNIVCETGNPPLLGDYPNTDGIWDVDSTGLAALVTDLNKGIDCNGLALATRTSLHHGARFNPSASDPAAEVERARSKVRAGARFLITRPVYEVDPLRRMLDELAAEGVPVLACVVPLRSFEEADYLAHEVPDLHIPARILTAMERAGERAGHVGASLAAELIAAARPAVQGVVLTLPSGDDPVFDLLLSATR
jgi:methionine synthase / methylenetetrahydrofolate reductase(NADPH)